MAELLVQDTSMIATADAIREKQDSTEAIEWVPGTGFANAIQALIRVPNGLATIKVGSYIPSSSSTEPVQIIHGLGRTPDIVFIFLADLVTGTPTHPIYEIINRAGVATASSYAAGVRGTTQPGSFTYSALPSSSTYTLTDQSFYLNLFNTTLIAGKRYVWMAFTIAS